MPRPRDAIVWNEDLVRGLRAREEQCRRQGSQRQYCWRDGAVKIEAVRADIYQFKTGRIIGLPKGLSKTVDEECRAMIENRKPIFPAGYVATTMEERQLVPAGNPYDNDPYLKKIKARGGAYAILLAFHHSTQQTLNKEQICRAAQPFCDEQMKESFHDGRTYGAWKSKDTLVKHGLLTQNTTRAYGENGWRSNGAWTWTLNDNGKQFIQALLKKFPQGAQRPNNFHDAATPVGMRDLGNALHEMNGLFAMPNRFARSPMTSPARKVRRTALVDKDEQEIRDWLVTAQPGEQKRLKVGKERRRFLHDFCQELEEKTPGLRLRHESAGEGTTRALYITLVSKGTGGSVASLPRSNIAELSSFLADDAPSLDSEGHFGSPRVKEERSSPKRQAFQGACRPLVEESPSKRMRVSAKEAAANAALLRQAMNASTAKVPRSAAQKPPTKRQLQFDVDDILENDDDAVDDPILRKAMDASKAEYEQSATLKSTVRRQDSFGDYETRPAVLSTHDDTDALLRQAMNASKAEYEQSAALKLPAIRQRSFDDYEARPAVLPSKEDLDRKPAAASKKKSNQRVVYNLDDSDDDDDIPPVARKASKANARSKESPIIIDLNNDDSFAKPSFSNPDAIMQQLYDEDEDIIDLADSQEVFVPMQYSLHSQRSYSDGKHDERETARLTDETADDDDIIDLAEDSQEIDQSFLTPKLAGETADETAGDEDIIDLEDSQESVPVIINPYTRATTKETRGEPAAKPNVNSLTILVDDRERIRNAKPRGLRTELTRHVESGALKSVWPSSLPPPEVVEQQLNYGDFAFVLGAGSGSERRLPVNIERKRVADLVQRSVRGDHWKQLQRMRDCCRCAVMLIEGDTRTAGGFQAHGAQDKEDWNPTYHCIDDEASLFRFVGRAILSSPTLKFFQAKDEQATHRAIGALGMMALVSEQEKPSQGAPVSTPSASTTHTILCDRLVKAGVPWELSRRVADEVGSVKKLDSLYNECTTEECKSALVCPIISSIQLQGSTSSKEDWSDAIFRCFYSTFNDPSRGRDRFDEYKHLVENQAILLSALHAEVEHEVAMEVAFSANQRPILPPRKVAIELTDGLLECFEVPTEESFYTLSVRKPQEDKNVPQQIVMQTGAGNLMSHRLFIHVVPAKALFDMVQKSVALNGNNFVRAAKRTAEQIDQESKAHGLKHGLDRRVIIFQGMLAACNAAAKLPGYREEVRVVVDLVFADLMYSHEAVVLQAVRLTNDLPLIVRQLALACFHYHLLTQEKTPGQLQELS